MRHACKVCVSCGAEQAPGTQSVIYYSESSIALARCLQCKEYLDFYVEFEFLLILLDLMLHRVSAFRHVLFNRVIKNGVYVRAFILLLIIDMFTSGWKSNDTLVIYGGYSVFKSIFKYLLMSIPSFLGLVVWDLFRSVEKQEQRLGKRLAEQLKIVWKCELLSKFPILLFIVASAWNYRVEFKRIIVLFLFTCHVVTYQALTNHILYSIFISIVSFFLGVLVEVYM